MSPPPPAAHRMPSGLRNMLILRLLLGSGLLGTMMFAAVDFPNLQTSAVLRVLITVVFGLTLLYYLLWRFFGEGRLLYEVQILADLIIISILVLYTDGPDSPFTFLYLFPIIAASMTLPRRSTLAIAAIAGFSYLLAVLDESYRWISPGDAVSASATLLSVNWSSVLFLHLTSFFLVAFLSSHLAEKLVERDRELQAASSSIEELQNLQAQIVNGMSIGLFTTDRRARFTSFNQAAESIVGYRWSQVRGQNCTALFPNFPLKSFLDFDLDEPTEAQLVEGQFAHPDGRSIFLTMSLSPLVAGNAQAAGMVGIFQDSTQLHEMRQNVQRTERLAAVGRLAAGIAHEIRNPLASLSGSLQILQDEEYFNDTNQRLLDIALREANHLNDTITEFLTYARPQQPELQPFDLNVLVKETFELLRNSPQYRPNISLTITCAPQPVMALVDVHQFKQVLWNLCLNALQSIEADGSLRVGTETARPAPGRIPGAPEGNDYVCLAVEDSGVGIPRDLQQQIFEPFFTTKRGGSGLGLAAVHRIIEGHGGSLQLESEPGRGSRFRILLPAVSQGAAASVAGRPT